MWDIFISESSDNLLLIEQCLLKIEEYGEDNETIDSLYRSLHTFKGNARLMGLSNMESITHYSEDIVGLIRDDGLKINSDLISLLLIVLDYLRNFLNIISSTESDISIQESKEIIDLLQEKYNEYKNKLAISNSENSRDLDFIQTQSYKNSDIENIFNNPNILHITENNDFNDEMYLYLYINTIESEYNDIIKKIETSNINDRKEEINNILQAWYNSTEKMGFEPLLNSINIIYQEFLVGKSENLIFLMTDFIKEIEGLKYKSNKNNLEYNLTKNKKFSELIEVDLNIIISFLEKINDKVYNDQNSLNLTLNSINNLKNISENDYINLHNILIEIENILLQKRYDFDIFLTQYNLFNELIKIEDINSNKYPFEEEMPSRINTLFRQWHANKIQVNIFRLQNEINLKDNINYNTILKLLDYIYHAFVFYNAKEICQLILSIKDNILRESYSISNYLKEKIDIFISISNKYINNSSNYFDLEVRDLICELNKSKTFSDFNDNNSTIKINKEIQQYNIVELLGLSNEFKSIITNENIDLINEYFLKGNSFYILKVNMDIDEKKAVEFHNWLNNEFLITSITLNDSVNEFEFLISSKKVIQELEESLKNILSKFSLRQININESEKREVYSNSVNLELDINNTSVDVTTSNKSDPKYLTDLNNHKEIKMSSENQMYMDSAYLRVHNSKINFIMDLVGEIGLVAGSIITNQVILKLNSTEIQTSFQNLESLIRELQGETSSLRLISVSNLFKQMNRLVRDLSKETGKKIKLEIFGEDTEIDKIAVDKLYDPLVHIIRNCIDHGIESEEERIKKNKNSVGQIKLKAIQQSNEIIVMISDDGRGLDKEKILKKAKEKNLLKNDLIDEKSIYNYIFCPGFSTADKITDISGRGVGMDIVQNTINELRGRISIETEKDIGTKIMIHLPLTMAFIEAMIVRIEDSLYAIPITYIKEVFKGHKKDVHKISSEKDTIIKIRDEIIPLVWLQQIFNEGSNNSYYDEIVVIINSTKGIIAVPVDELIGNQQITLKPLIGILKDIKAGAGYGILSNGDIVIVIDVERLHELKYLSI